MESVARIEIDRRVVADNVTPEKIQALQLGPVSVHAGDQAMVIDGPSIVVARAWVTDPDAWQQLPQSVRQGAVRRFDATQLQIAD